jgi:hypothetical protein
VFVFDAALPGTNIGYIKSPRIIRENPAAGLREKTDTENTPDPAVFCGRRNIIAISLQLSAESCSYEMAFT